MAKRRATLDEQIETLRRRGVVFEEMGEDRARYFLTYNSYYFKLKSYENNYQKKKKTEAIGMSESILRIWWNYR